MTSTIKVDTIQNSAGTTGLTIDSSGRVSRGVIPSWRLSLTADVDRTAVTEQEIPYDQSSGDLCYLDGGCTMSGGIVTVPVAGLYIITSVTRVNSVGSGYVLARTRINNSTAGNSEVYNIYGSPASNYDTLSMSQVYKLSADDNVRITIGTSADTNWSIDSVSTFSGALIG